MSRRGGLGRGLGALIPSAPVEDQRQDDGRVAPPVDDATALRPVPGLRLTELPIDAIEPNPDQPRTVFDEDALAELAASIREVGVLQPIVVRPLDGERYQIVMGERRYRASRLADQDTVPVLVRETPDDELLRDALLENLHRQQLNPLEEASAYRQLLEDFGATHEQLAARIGKSRAHVSNTLRLLNLPAKVQQRVAAGVLTAGHARALLGLDDPDEQDRLAQRIVAEGLSVRQVEEAVALRDVGRPEKQRTARTKTRSGRWADVETRLGDRLDTRVRIELGRSKGTLTIEFADADDLERIIGVLEA